MLVFVRKRTLDSLFIEERARKSSECLTHFLYHNTKLTTTTTLTSVIRVASQSLSQLSSRSPKRYFHNGREEKGTNDSYSFVGAENNVSLESIIGDVDSLYLAGNDDDVNVYNDNNNNGILGEDNSGKDCDYVTENPSMSFDRRGNLRDSENDLIGSMSDDSMSRTDDGWSSGELPSLLGTFPKVRNVMTKQGTDTIDTMINPGDNVTEKKVTYNPFAVQSNRDTLQAAKAAEYPEKKRREADMIRAISEISASINIPLRETPEGDSFPLQPQEDRAAATAAAVERVLEQSETATPKVIRELATFMMQNTVIDRIVDAKEDDIRALEGDSGGSGSELYSNPWALTPDEVIQYQRYLAERVTVPGAVKFKNPMSRILADQYGTLTSLYQNSIPSDSTHVSRILSYMSNRGQIPTTEILSDLMMCDISWQVALRIGQLYVSVTSPTNSSSHKLSSHSVPPVSMANRILAHLVLNSKRGGSSMLVSQLTATDQDDEKYDHNPRGMLWETGLSLYSSYIVQGRNDELTLVSHAHAVALLRSKFMYYGSTSPQRKNEVWINALDLFENVNATLDVPATSVSVDNGSFTKKTQIKGEEGLYYISEAMQLLTELNRWDVALKAMSLANFVDGTEISGSHASDDGHLSSSKAPRTMTTEEVGNTILPDGDYYSDLFINENDDRDITSASTYSTLSKDDEVDVSCTTKSSPVCSAANTLLVHTPETIASGMIAAATGGTISNLFILYENYKLMGYRYNYDFLSDAMLQQIMRVIAFSPNRASFPLNWVEAVFDDILRISTEEVTGDKEGDHYKVKSNASYHRNITRHMANLTLQAMQSMAAVCLSAMIPQVNEPDSSHWLRALTCFVAYEVTPPQNLASTGIVSKIDGFERALFATLYTVARHETIQRYLMGRVDHRSKVNGVKENITTEVSRTHTQTYPSTAAICGKLRDYIETCYGTMSIESALLSTKMLEISSIWPRDTDSYISWSQALALFHHNLAGSPLRSKRTMRARNGACQVLLNEVARSNTYTAEVQKEQKLSSHSMMPAMYQPDGTPNNDSLSWLSALTLLKGDVHGGKRCLYLKQSFVGDPFAAALHEAILLTYADGGEVYGKSCPEKMRTQQSTQVKSTDGESLTFNGNQIHNRVIGLLSLVPAKYIDNNLSGIHRQRMETYLITVFGGMSGEENVWAVIDKQRHRIRLSMLSKG